MSQEKTLCIVLASGSERRAELLSEAGYRFSVVVPPLDEAAFAADRVDVGEYACRLALAKARSVAPDYPERVVIAADTVVDLDGRVIGKPADAKEAEQITRELFSRPHKVVTGLAVVKLSERVELVESDSTKVFPRELTEEQIAGHIRSGTWRGKSGAYAIKEQDDEFVERIEGSLSNVMGLPMELLERMLAKLAR